MSQQFQVSLAPTEHLSKDDFLLVPPERWVQTCRATVKTTSSIERFLLIFAHSSATADLTLDAVGPIVRDVEREVTVALVTQSEEGKAAATLRETSADQLDRLAAAVAVMQASWGWDESRTIEVRVNEATFHLSPHYDGQSWVASRTSERR